MIPNLFTLLDQECEKLRKNIPCYLQVTPIIYAGFSLQGWLMDLGFFSGAPFSNPLMHRPVMLVNHPLMPVDQQFCPLQFLIWSPWRFLENSEVVLLSLPVNVREKFNICVSSSTFKMLIGTSDCVNYM